MDFIQTRYKDVMPLVAQEMKAKFQSRIYDGLQRVFGSEAAQGQNYSPEAQKQWQMMADAISDIAMDIVTELTTNAQVLPGQQVLTNGSPSTQTGATITPGQIA
jgi:predicted  nucleic acid-binding Zn ribbon protein